jgi:WD40 repeat protein
VAGAGVLIDQRHVLTCAHVVNQALRRDGQAQEPPGGEVKVDFVEAEADPIGARVAGGGWVPIRPDGVGDVAVLQLVVDAPRGARPAFLRASQRLGGHRFDTYGYPRRYDTGVGATGVLAAWGGPGNQWVELQGVEAPGHRVEGGFSGAAVHDQDAQAVIGIVVAEDKLAEAKLAWMLPVQTLTQLLGSTWPRLIAIVESSSMYQPGELAGHWSPKARGVERDAKRGWYFTGRTQVLRDLTEWLAGGLADGRVRAVTAGPGSGKSAVLARLITLSDPLYRERVPDLDPTDPTVPPAGSINVAVWAHAKTLEDVVAVIAQATEVDVDSPDALINGLLEADRPATIVVDALDEAVEPVGIAGKLLRPLAADAASAGVRVLVGSRPGRADELVAALGRDAVRLDLDQPPYLERDDLVEFVSRRLLMADDPVALTPYRGQKDLARRVADAVAARAYPTFLVAQLTSKALVQAGKIVDMEAPAWELSFPGSVADAMDGYLDRLAEDAPTEPERRARKRRLRELLTPLTYAEGEGLPRLLWPTAATAMAGRSYGLDQLDWLVDTAADYLIEQTTDQSGPIYRLYHQALAEYLRPTDPEEELMLQRRLATALIDTVPKRSDGVSRDWAAAHPYLTRHLATHTAMAGQLDQLVVDPAFLLAADSIRLLRVLSTVASPSAQAAARAYQQAVHQLGHDRPLEQRASCLQRAARYCKANNLAERILRLGIALPWTTQWAHWQASGIFRQLTGHVAAVEVVAFAQTDGQPVIVSGSYDHTIRVWDARSGQPRGEPLTGHTGAVVALAVGQIDQDPVIVSGSDDNTVRLWDGRSGQPRGKPLAGHSRVGMPSGIRVALVHIDGEPVIASGGEDGIVLLRDARSGQLRGEPLTAHTGPVVALEAGQINGDPVIVSGGVDGMVGVWDVRSGEHRGEPLLGHTAAVTAVAVGQIDGEPVIVSASDDDTVRIWDLRSGQPRGEPLAGHGGGVWAVAQGHIDGIPVIVSGGDDGTVRVWDARSGQPWGEPLAGHTSEVNGVAIGEIDGEPVIVSSGHDDTVRIWDARFGQPLGEGLAGHAGGVWALASGEIDGQLVVVSGGHDGTIRIWDGRSGQPRGKPLAGHRTAVWSVVLATVDEEPVLVASGDADTLRVWDARSGQPRGEPLAGHTGDAPGVEALAWGTVDGQPVIVSGGNDGTVRVWDAHSGQPRGRLSTGHGAVRSVDVVQIDGESVIISSGNDGTVRVWDAHSGQPRGKPLVTQPRWVSTGVSRDPPCPFLPSGFQRV